MRRPTVLLVDDEPHVTAALARVWHGQPVTVRRCASAAEALECLMAERVHVLVADEKMPGMSGSQLLAVVRRQYPETVRFMLTGHIADEAAIRALRDGDVQRFFTKPLDAEELLVAIVAAVESQANGAPPVTTGAALPRAATDPTPPDTAPTPPRPADRASG
jgi:DNA-binding NtrC family response regulator